MELLISLVVLVVVVGIVYLIAKALLPEPIPLVIALIGLLYTLTRVF